MNVKIAVFASLKGDRAVGRKLGVRIYIGAFAKLDHVFRAVIFHRIYCTVYRVISADFSSVVIERHAIKVGIVFVLFGKGVEKFVTNETERAAKSFSVGGFEHFGEIGEVTEHFVYLVVGKVIGKFQISYRTVTLHIQLKRTADNRAESP